MHKKLGERIIICEEIITKEGEIIGLFLKETIPGGIRVEEAVARIKHQGGLVYLPHPFENFRLGLQQEVIDRIIDAVAIVEVFNAREQFQATPTLTPQSAS